MRQIDADIQQHFEATDSEHFVITVLRVSSPDLDAPFYICDDVVNYMYDGNLVYGMPFQLTNLTDGDKAPEGSVGFSNADRRIGEAFRNVSRSPMLRIEVLSVDDFAEALIGTGLYYDDGEEIRARYPIGTPLPIMVADYLKLKNASVDNAVAQASIVSYNSTSEPWPRIRTTKARTPALYR